MHTVLMTSTVIKMENVKMDVDLQKAVQQLCAVTVSIISVKTLTVVRMRIVQMECVWMEAVLNVLLTMTAMWMEDVPHVKIINVWLPSVVQMMTVRLDNIAI